LKIEKSEVEGSDAPSKQERRLVAPSWLLRMSVLSIFNFQFSILPSRPLVIGRGFRATGAE
jgi:hypothetical protein